ncbi:MAG TPA: glycosyl hydrolase family 28-related protein [Gemmatimonadaceae bacterium]|jgi:hypothetical protein
MTVTSTNTRNDYLGSGTTGPFAFNYKIFAATHLNVFTTDLLGNVTQLNYPADFTVSAGGIGAKNGGSITTTNAVTSGWTLTIERVVPLVQDSDFRNQGEFFPEDYEDALDYGMMVDQQLAADALLALHVPSIPANVDPVISTFLPSYYLRVRSDGLGVEGVTDVIADPGFLQSGTGAVERTANAKMAEIVSVKDFGAVGDSTTDNLAAFTAAMTYVHGLGGGTILVPPGTYKFSATLTMLANVILQGQSPAMSILTWATTGDGIKFPGTINVQNIAKTSVRDLALVCTNGSNTGGGYVDVGGTFVSLFNVHISGFNYGVIFDQTELGDIDLCNIESQLRAAIWLVNGPDHTVGASGAFTNRISVKRCQINESNSVAGIVDDGGYAHELATNNYNGCSKQVRVAGALGHVIIGGEWEGSSGSPLLEYTNTTFNSGTGVGNSEACSVTGGLFLQTNAQGCISIIGVNALTIRGAYLSTSGGVVKIQGVSNSVGFITVIGCSGHGTGALIDSLGMENTLALSSTPNNDVALPLVNMILGGMEFIRIFGETADFTITGFVADYAGRLVQIFNASAHVMTIANASASSAAANRITSSTGADVTIAAKGSIVLRYSHDIPGWVVVSTS